MRHAEGTTVSMPRFSISPVYFTLFLVWKQLPGMGFIPTGLVDFAACKDCPHAAAVSAAGDNEATDDKMPRPLQASAEGR